MGETSHGNRYLEGVKSIVVLLAQTHFTTVKNYRSVQVQKWTAKEPPGISSVQSLGHVRLSATPWIAARQACPSPTPGVYKNLCPWVDDAIQTSHPLLSPSPLTPNPSQHQSLFQWVNSSLEVLGTKACDMYFLPFPLHKNHQVKNMKFQEVCYICLEADFQPPSFHMLHITKITL